MFRCRPVCVIVMCLCLRHHKLSLQVPVVCFQWTRCIFPFFFSFFIYPAHRTPSQIIVSSDSSPLSLSLSLSLSLYIYIYIRERERDVPLIRWSLRWPQPGCCLHCHSKGLIREEKQKQNNKPCCILQSPLFLNLLQLVLPGFCGTVFVCK